ncbi:MAG: dihydrodipicolinate synthase family protein [Verrucomicrobia bacterium]|jgi:N-acetylneuraminate lyase|nr:dihydrodipicolinate synthase family protein [Verrucomicrobiota bacterium]
MQNRFRGLVAAPFTPFNADRSINLDVIPTYARFLRENGVSAAFVCGTTGEGLSLTLEERLAVSAKWVESADKSLPVIVHVGHTCLEDARKLTAHAAKIGAAAVSALAPMFFKPRNTDELVDWCEAVASAAPSLPFYYYNIPSMTGVTFPVAEFLAKAAERIPTLVGVKYTYEDFPDYGACVTAAAGRFDILFGRDELLLEGWKAGARGAVGSTYNYAAPLYLRVLAAHQKGDAATARKLQDTAIKMIAICNGVGVTHLAASKALMAMLGVDCGPVRLPLTQPSAAQLVTVRAQLTEIGFFDFACRPVS